MTFSQLTSRTVSTPYQDRGRGGAKITTIVLHHMASTSFEGVLSMWTKATRQGSANYAVSNEGQVVCAVAEENRSWSLANYAFDAHSITFEIENESLGGAWPVSAAAHEATARVVADICTRYGIACNRTNILGHREVYTRYGVGYSTACPGGLNIDQIVNRANQILAGVESVTTPEPEESDMKLIWDPSTKTVAAVGAGRYFPFGPTTGTSDSSRLAVEKVWGATNMGLTHEEFLENVHASGGDPSDISKPFPA